MISAQMGSDKQGTLVARIAKWIGSKLPVAFLGALALVLTTATLAQASEADVKLPNLYEHGSFKIFGKEISAGNLLFYGSFVIAGTLGISLFLLAQIRKLPAHKSMLDVAEIIFQTCKTYLIQQGKFLLMLFVLIAIAMTYYFKGLQGESTATAMKVLFFSIIGMAGSYAVAWYGIRVNTYANARTAFASLRGKPWDVVNIPLRAGMSIGLFPDLARTDHDGDHSPLHRSKRGRLLLPRFRHRRVAGCIRCTGASRVAFSPRSADFIGSRPDEDRFQGQ